MLHHYSKPCSDFLSLHPCCASKALCDLIPAMWPLPLPFSALVTSLSQTYWARSCLRGWYSRNSCLECSSFRCLHVSFSHFVRSLLKCTLIREVFLDHCLWNKTLCIPSLTLLVCFLFLALITTWHYLFILFFSRMQTPWGQELSFVHCCIPSA